jgi:hypothetical protein
MIDKKRALATCLAPPAGVSPLPFSTCAAFSINSAATASSSCEVGK